MPQAEQLLRFVVRIDGPEDGLQKAQDEGDDADYCVGMLVEAVHIDEDQYETAAGQQPGEEHVQPVVLSE